MWLSSQIQLYRRHHISLLPLGQLMLPRIPVLIRLEFSFIHLVLLPPCSLSYVKVKVPRFYQVPKSRGNCSDHWSTARRHTPASMVLPSLTARSTGLFPGARTHRLTVPPPQVTHCLFLPSPPPGFAASQGTDRNGGGSWLFFDPPPTLFPVWVRSLLLLSYWPQR